MVNKYVNKCQLLLRVTSSQTDMTLIMFDPSIPLELVLC